MDEQGSREWQGIRDAQRDLRRQLDTLDLRIGQIEEARRIELTPPPLPQVSQRSAPTPAPAPEPALVAEKPPLFPPPFAEKTPPVFSEKPSPPPIKPFEPASAPTPPKEKGALEMQLGKVWLVRVGILIMLTGLVFLGNFAWNELVTKLGAIGKLTLIYLAGGALAGAGWWVKRNRESLANYGKVLIGGGIATVYYATYAAHFVEPLRVIASPLLGGFLLIALAAAIIGLADRMRSEAVAAVTVLLGFYTSAINPIAGFSLFSNLVLSVIAIVLLVRQRWLSVSFFSLIGCYAAFAFWRFQTGALFHPPSAGTAAFWTAVLFPACYWLTFTVATFIGHAETFKGATRPAFLTINNGAFFSLTAPVVAIAYPNQFWLYTLAFGVLLLGLALVASRRESDDKAFDGTYLTQGLALLSLAFLFKFSDYQLAIILALQSGTLLKLSRIRHGKILQIFSGLSAILAAGTALIALNRGTEHAALTSAAVSLLLIANAWLFKSQRGLLQTVAFHFRAAGYVALATGLATATILYGTHDANAVYALIGLALLGTASIYALRLPEVVLGGQAVAGVAVLGWFAITFEQSPFVGLLAVLIISLAALMHWWQHQQIFALGQNWRLTWQSVHALAVISLLFGWTFLHYNGSERMVALAILAVGLLLYAIVTRAWPLAIGSQAFTFASGFLLILTNSNQTPSSVLAGTLALIATNSLVLRLLGQRVPATANTEIRQYSLFIRIVSVLIGYWIMENRVPEAWHFLAFSSVSFVFFLLSQWRPRIEVLIYAAVALILGFISFALRNMISGAIHPSDLIGLGLILIAQQIARRSTATVPFFLPAIHSTLIVLGLGGVWLVMGRMVSGGHGGFLLTVSWSVYAFVVFGVGLLLRERLYRLIALALVALSIGRLCVIDVWQFDTLSRILSFMVLGGVLLALGFLYNRFSDLFRKWM